MNALEVTSIPYKMSGAHQKGPKTVNAPAKKPGVLEHLTNHKRQESPPRNSEASISQPIMPPFFGKRELPTEPFLIINPSYKLYCSDRVSGTWAAK
jgi:hypothetical protein